MKLYRAQFISMIIMTALGIGVFTGFNMEWYTIERDVDSFFEETGFADFRIISETGFSEEECRAVGEIDGVGATSRYLSVNAVVKDGTDVVAVTVSENPAVSGFAVSSGGEYDPESSDGLWLSDRYADENGISCGDTLELTYKNLSFKGRVAGLVKASEYLICVPDPTQLMPDYSSYGFAYVSPAMLEKIMGQGFFTQINVISDMDKADFAEAVKDKLGKTYMIVSKDDTISYSEAMGESEEGKTMAAILPVLFLAIAVLTMVTTMHRLTATEKTQIGTLKSLGFKDRRITLHYVSYAVMIGLVGTALGIGIGFLLGWYIMNPSGAMGTYIDMPDWTLHTPTFVWIVIAAVNVLLILIGYLSVKSMLKGTAADALRPYTPKKMRKIFAERFSFWDKLGFGTKWNFRDVVRHKARTFMTLFGIIGCTVIVFSALGIQDTLDSFVDLFYSGAINYETKINLDADSATPDDAEEIAEKYSGDLEMTLSVQLDGEAVGIEVYDIRRGLIRFIDENEKYVGLTDDGAYVCERIADKFSVGVGDEIVFSPFGTDDEYTVKIAGKVRSLTESVVMTRAAAEDAGIPFSPNVIYTADTDIAQDVRIVNTQTKYNIMDSFDTFMELMVVMVWLLIIAAVILGVVVLYNLGVMSYTERYREMATLKVIGFKDGKIGRLLIGQNMWLTLVGSVLGIPAAIGILKYLVKALASEYEMELAVAPSTYIISIALTFGVSLLVGLMVSRKNKKIDMVEALKGRE